MTGAGFAARTDTGMVRDHNEDAILAEHPLYAVADGVGGAAAGEVASGLAIRTLSEAREELATAAADGDTALVTQLLITTITAAHDRIVELHAERGHSGMSTTLTAVVAVGDDQIVVGHVGDSRAYRLDTHGIEQLTADHSLVAELVRSGSISEAEARTHPQANVILQALGGDANIQVDTISASLAPGAVLLVCSDGLSGQVEDPRIAELVAAAPDLDVAADDLITAANAAGGPDNISVVLARLAAGDANPAPVPAAATQAPVATAVTSAPAVAPDDRRRVWAIGGVAAVIVALILGAVAWSQSYFLGEADDGTVAVFRGFPVPGMHETYRRTELEVDSLSSFDQQQYVERSRLRSQGNANRVLDDLLDSQEQVDNLGDVATPDVGRAADPGEPVPDPGTP